MVRFIRQGEKRRGERRKFRTKEQWCGEQRLARGTAEQWYGEQRLARGTAEQWYDGQRRCGYVPGRRDGPGSGGSTGLI